MLREAGREHIFARRLPADVGSGPNSSGSSINFAPVIRLLQFGDDLFRCEPLPCCLPKSKILTFNLDSF